MKRRMGPRAFDPGYIGNIEIKNRLVRSATYECGATGQGEVTDVLVNLYETLARGGAGLLITGHTAVHEKGISSTFMMRICDDSFMPGLQKITDAVHGVQNDCKIMVQLTHPGRQVRRPDIVEPVAPSALYDPYLRQTPRALEVEEIDGLIEAFACAVMRAREAGFDGVQFHAAHGWLLSSFLSPHTNRREDSYGGSTENRTRIVREICERSRKKVGRDFPLLIKINGNDYIPGGVDVAEASRIACLLSMAGFSAIEVSGCMWETLTRSEEELGWKPVPIPESRVGVREKDKEAYFLPEAWEIKRNSTVPIILVGGIRSLDTIEEILDAEAADFCALCRPLIREPGLPAVWQQKGTEKSSSCISCNACVRNIIDPGGDKPVQCKVERAHS